MKTYFKVIAVFMVILILIGSVFGWDLTSFSSASASATNFVSFLNMVGTSTLHSLDSLTLLPDYVMGMFAPRDENLPQSYKDWTKLSFMHSGTFRQFSEWYKEAYLIVWGKEYTGDTSKLILTVTTVTELYHYDMFRVIMFDDYDAYHRATDDGTWRPIMELQWVFQRGKVHSDFEKLLGNCMESHEFSTNADDAYWVDIILKYEFNYKGE